VVVDEHEEDCGGDGGQEREMEEQPEDSACCHGCDWLGFRLFTQYLGTGGRYRAS
jgi:hypothetical protein